MKSNNIFLYIALTLQLHFYGRSSLNNSFPLKLTSTDLSCGYTTTFQDNFHNDILSHSVSEFFIYLDKDLNSENWSNSRILSNSTFPMLSIEFSPCSGSGKLYNDRLTFQIGFINSVRMSSADYYWKKQLGDTITFKIVNYTESINNLFISGAVMYSGKREKRLNYYSGLGIKYGKSIGGNVNRWEGNDTFHIASGSMKEWIYDSFELSDIYPSSYFSLVIPLGMNISFSHKKWIINRCILFAEGLAEINYTKYKSPEIIGESYFFYGLNGGIRYKINSK